MGSNIMDDNTTLITTSPSIISPSPEDQLFTQEMLARRTPSYRLAYSDRTAWLMACMAQLAYIRFNPPFLGNSQEEQFRKAIEKLLSGKKLSMLTELIDSLGYDAEREKGILTSELNGLNFKLERLFDNKETGTQAFLASTDEFLVLAFRGTETTSVKDIRADIKANKVSCATEGMVHQGFKESYESVASYIQKAIDEPKYVGKPLLIAGHSLGGALATIAAKRLTCKGDIAACYTFGSPSVGTAEWIAPLKTPVYRIVNAADAVTLLPPSSATISVLAKACSFIPRFGKSLSKGLMDKFGGYLHTGDMRYLTNCAPGDYQDVQLLPAVTFFYRLFGFLNKNPIKSKPLADHSIATYRKKLGIVAQKRNKNTLSY